MDNKISNYDMYYIRKFKRKPGKTYFVDINYEEYFNDYKILKENILSQNISTKKKESELKHDIKQREIKQEEKIVEKQETELEIIERLFAESLTKNQFKDLWIEKYKTAKAGKSLGKENVYAEKIKKGEFQIDELEGIPRVFPFSDYDTRSKDVDEILNDKWLKNK